MKRISPWLLVAAATAQLGAQQKVPLRELAPVNARTSTNFGLVFGVRALPGGSVLVDDGINRQLVMLDSTLANPKVVIDSAAGTNSYGPRASPIIPYLGDSTLFVDGTSLSLLVIDPKGSVARVMSAPRPGDLRFLGNSASGIDNRGRLIYKSPLTISNVKNSGNPADKMVVQPPDSSPILRADFDTRTVDTIGRVNQASGRKTEMVRGANDQMTVHMTLNPLVPIDEWAVLSDGSVAFVRGHDYHVDILANDGTVSAGGKLPFDWKRLTDEDKQHLIDSATAAQAAQAAANAKAAEAMKNGGDPLAAAAKAGAEGAMVMSVRVGAMGGDGGGGGGGGGMPMQMPMVMTPTIDFVPVKEIADYYPPIRLGAAKADMDGNLWILPTTSAQSVNGELVYDVVNNKGDLTERVRLPAGRSIAGFGHGGVVYLMSGDRTKGFALERTRIIGGSRVAQ